MKIKRAVTQKLFVWLAVAMVFATCVFAFLIVYMQKITDKTAGDLGEMYMSEMMWQLQDHLESIVEIKLEEVEHIAVHANGFQGEELRENITDIAKLTGFDYVALYDNKGNYETIFGKSAWYHNINGFVENVLSGKKVATTGYLTNNGSKYIVFGIPAYYEMDNGVYSDVLLAGFSVEKLYEYIEFEKENQYSNNASISIILTNGSYVLKRESVESDDFYTQIKNTGDFVDVGLDEGIADIEKAMSGGKSFSCAVSTETEEIHVYGAAAKSPSNWYLVLTMPRSATDTMIDSHSEASLGAFAIACFIVLSMLFILFGLYMRLSNQQLAETELARAEAESANRAKSTFLFNASHDIRTPMNAIQGFARIIEKNHDNSELVKETISKINQSGDTLMQLLNDVLELSRIESGRLELELKPLDLDEQIKNIKTMFQQDMAAAKLDFSVETDIKDSVVICDGLKLTQILMNLLSNAKKFTPEGGKVVCGVKQNSSSDGIGEYTFYVRDTGIGMSEEFQKSAFEQFERERTSTVSGVQGSGLGLSIVKSIVNKMEGSCELESKLGEGSEFRIKLKLPISDINLSIDNTKSNSAIDVSGKTVLLVEDNDFNREITRYILEELGMSVVEAEDGSVALETLKNNPPDTFDLILMDIQMPIMDGFTASREIRSLKNDKYSKIPIIALTANAFNEDRERCINAGMNAHICKPIDPEKLRETIAKLTD